MWAALQHSEWVTILATNRWLFGVILVVHCFAICFCVGTTLLLNLRILGVASRQQAVTQLAEQLRPWTWMAFGFAVLSGFFLFATEAGDYAAVTPFRLKMIILMAAVTLTIVVEQNVTEWERAPAMPVGARLVAIVSIVLWLGVILVGVEIAPLTGLG
jgi:hypothetical protein